MKKLLCLLLLAALMLSVSAPAFATVDKLTHSADFTVSPEELVYDGTAKHVLLIRSSLEMPDDWTGLAGVAQCGGNCTGTRNIIYLKIMENASPVEVTDPVEAGVYQVRIICSGDRKYTAGNHTSENWTFEIKKAALSITPPQPVSPLVADGSSHALVTPGSVEALPGDEVKMVYSLSAEGPFSEEIPTASAPGTYKVYYTAEEHSCYETAEVGSCDVTINAAVTPTPKPTATPSPAPAPLPETGDGTPLMMLAALAALSCLCIFAFLQKNKRVSE